MTPAYSYTLSLLIGCLVVRGAWWWSGEDSVSGQYDIESQKHGETSRLLEIFDPWNDPNKNHKHNGKSLTKGTTQTKTTNTTVLGSVLRYKADDTTEEPMTARNKWRSWLKTHATQPRPG